MKQRGTLIGLFLAISLLVGIPLSSQTAYDKDAVVKVMRQNQALIGQIRGAIGKADFYAAATGFWKFAEGMQMLRSFAAPRGDQAAWDSLLAEFVFASLRGVGAAGAMDAALATKSLQELQALNQKGHGAFK